MRYLVLWFAAIAIVIGSGAAARVAVASDDDNWKGVDDTSDREDPHRGRASTPQTIYQYRPRRPAAVSVPAGRGRRRLHSRIRLPRPVSAPHGGERPCTASLNYSLWTRGPAGAGCADGCPRQAGDCAGGHFGGRLVEAVRVAAGDAGLLAGPVGGLRAPGESRFCGWRRHWEWRRPSACCKR